MFIIQNNQILVDVLIKYIANYHILYSGQLEIRLIVSYMGICFRLFVLIK